MKGAWKYEVVGTVIAIGASVILLVGIVFFTSSEPFKAVYYLFLGPFLSLRKFGNVLEIVIPLIFTGIATSIIFSSRSFNIASESAFYFGGVTAMALGLSLDGPTILLLPAICMCAGAAGVIIVGLPGFLRARTGSSELVTSLMLNYVVLYLGLYIFKSHFKDYTINGLGSWKLPDELLLKSMFGRLHVNAGWVIALIVVLLGWYLMDKSVWGRKVKMTGMNPEFSRYCGINATGIAFSTQAVGGFIAGLGGAVELLGRYRRFTWIALPGFGWDGIIVAALARNKPTYVPLAAFFLAYIRIGADIMARHTDTPQEILSMIQGTLIILIISKRLTRSIERKSVRRTAMDSLSVEAGGLGHG